MGQLLYCYRVKGNLTPIPVQQESIPMKPIGVAYRPGDASGAHRACIPVSWKRRE
jgi:hypothetical protein